MQSQLVLYILGALAFSCAAEEAACAATGDADDDRCTLLQSNVGVASVDKAAEVVDAKVAVVDAKVIEAKVPVVAVQHEAKVVDAKEHQAKSSNAAKPVSKGASDHVKEYVEGSKGDVESWPDIMKAITGVIGGVGQLEKDFDAVKDAVVTFELEVHSAEKVLIEGIDKSNSLELNLGKVEGFYSIVYNASLKVVEALKKVANGFLEGIGKIIPAQFKTVLTSMLTSANDEAKLFAAKFDTAAASLKSFRKQTNATTVCAQVKEGLHGVLKKASDFAKSATGLTTKGFSKDLKAARDALPETLQEEINKVIKKANDAADQLLSKLTPAMKEITDAVTTAFEDHCPHLPSGTRQVEVGLLLGLVLSVLSFSM